MSDNTDRPVVISVVSGKGGVGKSRISLVLAGILAKKYKVLLVDFDLHNQGLTHLVDGEPGKGEGIGRDPGADAGFDAPAEIAPNVYFVPAPKTVAAGPLDDLEALHAGHSSADFRDYLGRLVAAARARVPVRFVIVDNTGIPDHFSLGSALFADRVLLITQTDSVTWRGALNFYSIYERSGGDPARISFIVNNIPKKYSYELVNFEVNKLGEVFKNMGFTLFIPFEYGIFESFDRDPLDDRSIEQSEFYKKVRLLSAIILKEANVERSFELEAIYTRKNALNRSLAPRLGRSGDTLKHLLIVKSFQLTFAALFIIFGLVTVGTFYPGAIPGLLSEVSDGHFFPMIMVAASFLVAAGLLSMSAERFGQFIGSLGEKKTERHRGEKG